MFLKIVELFVKLLEQREKNKIVVLQECLYPLKKEIDTLHADWLDKFHNYRHTILAEGKTSALMDSIVLDIDKSIARQSDVIHQLLGLFEVSGKKLDGYGKMAKELAVSVVEYLGFFGYVISDAQLMGLIGRSDPAFLGLYAMLSSASTDVKEVEMFINLAIAQLKKKYEMFLKRYSDFKTSLLT